tara:strand:+ start:2170 stop:2490 length:321 start_codon:yes stop_codon:yes gene_type:complete
MNGELEGKRIFSSSVIDEFTREQWHHPCPIWGLDFRMGLGLSLNGGYPYLGPNPKAFGAAGGGGSFGLADRENQLSIGYCLNNWWPKAELGARATGLINATYASLE